MTKYDWSNVPKEVNWIATDSNGNVFGYYKKPKLQENGYFMHIGDNFYYPEKGWMESYNGNWIDSLEERPK